MKQLILAEKPSVAKDLAKVLGATPATKSYYEGKNAVITWAFGHLVGLKMPEDYNREWSEWQLESLPLIPKKMGIKPLPKTQGQLKAIRQLVARKDISEVVIATDAGREGELVARWILEYVRNPKPIKRLWISSQTDKAIRQGMAHLQPGKAYDNLYQSALARAKADWLVGLNVTRGLTVKYQDQLAAGRVQTPTLAFVAERDHQIQTFQAQTYVEIQAEFAGRKATLQIGKQNRWQDRAQAEERRTTLAQKAAIVGTIKKQKSQQTAPLPYDLTELQREANTRYQFSAKKTLNTLQKLYEQHKIVSYPRTDSRYLTRDLQQTMKERVEALRGAFPSEVQEILKGQAKVQQTAVFQDSKVTDHHGLIPTEQAPNVRSLSQDEWRIYQLIVERFFGLFAAPYVEEKQSIQIKIGEAQATFKSSVVLEAGWKTKTVEKETKQPLLELKEGSRVDLQLTTIEKLTTPPGRLNEGSLLGAMEKHHLGTPATRAEIIEKLVKSELMERNQGQLRVSPKGQQLLHLVNPALASYALTEKWENQLEKIAEGQLPAAQFLAEIEAETKRLVQEIKQSDKTYRDFSVTQKKCPDCGAPLKERQTREGKIYVCTADDCRYRRRKDPKVTNRRCPQCHKKMVILDSQKGEYFKCLTCSFTDKVSAKKGGKKKMSKHEERRLVQKYTQQEPTENNALAEALKAAMAKQEK